MHLLITGGMGYIGSHTCVELLKAGHEVTIVDNLSNSQSDVAEYIKKITGKHCDFFQADIRDVKALDKIFSHKPVDAVIHFAALKAVGESVLKPLLYYENNVYGTLNLLIAMKKANVKRIIFSSSATVYGDSAEVPVTESTALKPAVNPYGAGKQMVERILADEYSSDQEWSICVLRYFNPVGAHESGLIGENPKDIPNNLLPYVAKVASGDLAYLNIFGNDYPTADGTGARDYIHVTDLALGHIAALNKHKNDQGVFIYNLGTGQYNSVLQVLHAFEKACGKTIPYKFAKRRKGDIAISYANTEKAKTVLQWKATHSLDDTMKDAWNWQLRYLKNRNK